MEMLRDELIEALQDTSEEVAGYRWNKEDCNDLLNIFTTTITKCLIAGREPIIYGFGKFKVATRAKHRIANPNTGEHMMTRELKVPMFQAGETLKREIKEMD